MSKKSFPPSRLTSQSALRCDGRDSRGAWPGREGPRGPWLWRRCDTREWRRCLQPVSSPVTPGTGICMKSCCQLTTTTRWHSSYWIGNIHWALINTFYNCLIPFLCPMTIILVIGRLFWKCQKVQTKIRQKCFYSLEKTIWPSGFPPAGCNEDIIRGDKVQMDWTVQYYYWL